MKRKAVRSSITTWPKGILSRVSREAYDSVNRARGIYTPEEREAAAVSYDKLFGRKPK